MPARDFSQHEGSTHINLIEQLRDLSLAGNGVSGDSQQEVYGNGTAEGSYEDTDLLGGRNTIFGTAAVTLPILQMLAMYVAVRQLDTGLS